jgi:hypothetical protein
VHFVQEFTCDIIPANPSMLDVNTEGPEPEVDPPPIEVLGIGSSAPQALYKGMQKVDLKIPGISSPSIHKFVAACADAVACPDSH